jgi:undecaprenyl-diphosphatase
MLFGGEVDRRYVLVGLGIAIVNVAIYTLLKIYFKRRRPILFLGGLRSRTIEKYSFPSGHSAVSFGMALVISYFYPIIWIQIVSYFVAAFISLSRVYVEEHYPLDVIFGAVLGTSIAALLLPLFERAFL